MILLDTHAWLWWCADPAKLSRPAKQKIRQGEADGGVRILSLSCWELAMLVAKGRVGLTMDVQEWIDRTLETMDIQLMEITPKSAVLATRLAGVPPADPVDRLLIATALVHQCPIVTKDRHIRRYPHVQAVW